MKETASKVTACWIYAINRFGYPPSIDNSFEAINRLADLEFTSVELETVFLPGKDESNLGEVYSHCHEIRRQCDQRGLAVANFFTILPDLVDLDPERRARGRELYDRSIEIACTLGSPLISLDSFPPPSSEPEAARSEAALAYGQRLAGRLPWDFSWKQQWQIMIDAFAEASERAERAGLRLAVEPRVGEMVSNTDAAIRLIEAVDSANLGVVLDTGHQHAQKENLPLAIHKLAGRIFFVHLSDNDGRDNLHLPLGEGAIDWEAFFEALQEVDYQGSLGIDVGGVADIDAAFLNSRQYILRLTV